jgi:hypothetical protein
LFLGGGNHGGVTQKVLPTFCALMNRRQESCQFSSSITRH